MGASEICFIKNIVQKVHKVRIELLEYDAYFHSSSLKS